MFRIIALAALLTLATLCGQSAANTREFKAGRIAASLFLHGSTIGANAGRHAESVVLFAQANERKSRAFIGRPDPRDNPRKSAQARQLGPRVLVNRPTRDVKARRK